MKKAIVLMSLVVITTVGVLVAQNAGVLPKQESAEGAKSYIISPADGDTVSGTFTVQFGLKGMGIAPAGIAPSPSTENTGHHHLLIDQAELPNLNVPLPAIEGKIIHFGKGQTETELTLPSGTHTLQLVLGDYLHIPHNPPVVSEKITITVE